MLKDKIKEILEKFRSYHPLTKGLVDGWIMNNEGKQIEVKDPIYQAHSEIMYIIFVECEKVSQEYQKRIREEYVPKTLMLTKEEILEILKQNVCCKERCLGMEDIAIALHTAQEEKIK